MPNRPLPLHPHARPADAIKRRARDLGFDLVGIAPASRPANADFYLEWLERGYGGAMSYLAREDAVRRRLDPAEALDGARSIVVVAMNYNLPDDGPVDEPERGVIARYARGRDYHEVFESKLADLSAALTEIAPSAKVRCYVDYGPVLERDHAQRAGLGWIGKNTVLIHPRIGSYLFLGEILTDAELEADDAFLPDHCGTCARCIEACPTGAIRGPRELDSRLCISYLTIELRGPIPRELRPLIGNRIFGCDICQEVCPFNRFAEPTEERDFRADWRAAADRPDVPPEMADTRAPSLTALMRITEEDWERQTRGSAIRRAGYSGFKRNVAVALGNWASAEAVPVLAEALQSPEPLVRGHAAWALGETGTAEAHRLLEERLRVEEDDWVRREVDEALENLPTGSQNL